MYASSWDMKIWLCGRLHRHMWNSRTWFWDAMSVDVICKDTTQWKKHIGHVAQWPWNNKAGIYEREVTHIQWRVPELVGQGITQLEDRRQKWSPAKNGNTHGGFVLYQCAPMNEKSTLLSLENLAALTATGALEAKDKRFLSIWLNGLGISRASYIKIPNVLVIWELDVWLE